MCWRSVNAADVSTAPGSVAGGLSKLNLTECKLKQKISEIKI